MEGWDGSFTRPYYLTTMLDVLDFAILGGMMLFSVLLGLLVAYKVAKPRILHTIRGVGVSMGNSVGKQISKTIENVDVGEIMGQLGGGEGEGLDLGALSSLAGTGKGGLGDLLGMLTKLGGKSKGGGGSSGW